MSQSSRALSSPGEHWWVTLLRLAVPATVGALIQSTIFFVEASFVAEVGSTALAAVAVVFPLLMLTMMLSAGAVGGAIAGATARALGAGDTNRASAVLLCACGLALFFWFVKTALILSYGEAFFYWAGARGDALVGAQAYAQTIFSGALLIWLFNMLSSVLRGGGDMRGPSVAIAVVLGFYIVWMMTTFEAAPELADSLRAASTGVLMAYSVGLAVVTYLILRPAQPVRFRRPRRTDWGVVRAVLRQGSVAGTQSLATVGYSFVATAIMARLGGQWLAAYGVVARLELLLIPLVFGVGGSLIALVGAHVGAGEREQGIRMAWRGAWLTMALLTLIGMVLAIWPEIWCAPVSSDRDVATHCEQALRIIAPFYGWFGLGLCLYFASQGLDTLIWPVAGAIIRLLIVVAALALGSSYLEQPGVALALVSFAMLGYGLFVATALWRGPWKPRRQNSIS